MSDPIAVLRRFEWSGGGAYRSCPCCGGYEPGQSFGREGHVSGCALNGAIQSVERMSVQIRDLERQNGDLQATNNRCLQRARDAEAALKQIGGGS